MSVENPLTDEYGGAGDDAGQPLLDLLDALVNERGWTGAAEALGVNYRTVARCQRSRRVSRLMRQALVEFRDSQGVGDGGDGTGDDLEETLRERAAALERENRELRETVEAQAAELERLRQQIAEMGDQGQPAGGNDAVDGGQGQPEGWQPPRRGHGMPDAGVVTLEEQHDEERAFGPAAPLVTEWRELRNRDFHAHSRLEQAVAAVRRWELETEMLLDWQLTLPPEAEPLNESRRQDQLRWREEALAGARRELRRAKLARLSRRVLTLGLWRR